VVELRVGERQIHAVAQHELHIQHFAAWFCVRKHRRIEIERGVMMQRRQQRQVQPGTRAADQDALAFRRRQCAQ
jgi:hypothetical protein